MTRSTAARSLADAWLFAGLFAGLCACRAPQTMQAPPHAEPPAPGRVEPRAVTPPVAAAPRYDFASRVLSASPDECLVAVVEGVRALAPYTLRLLALEPDRTELTVSLTKHPPLAAHYPYDLTSQHRISFARGGCDVQVFSFVRDGSGREGDFDPLGVFGKDGDLPRASAQALVAAIGAAAERGVRVRPSYVAVVSEARFQPDSVFASLDPARTGDNRSLVYLRGSERNIQEGFCVEGSETACALSIAGVHRATVADVGAPVALVALDANVGLGALAWSSAVLVSNMRRLDGTPRFASLDTAVTRLRAELARWRRSDPRIDDHAFRKTQAPQDRSLRVSAHDWVEGALAGDDRVVLRVMHDVFDSGAAFEVRAAFGVEETVDAAGNSYDAKRVPPSVTASAVRPPVDPFDRR